MNSEDQTALKKYCPFCEEMHELKMFPVIGFGMYGRARICKKGYAAQTKKRSDKLRAQREIFKSFSPV